MRGPRTQNLSNLLGWRQLPSVANGAQPRELFEGFSKSCHSAHSLTLVFEGLLAAGTEGQQEILGKLRQRIRLAHREEDPQQFVGLELPGSSLPHPGRMLDLVEHGPGKLTRAGLKSPALEEPVDDRNRQHDSHDFGAEVDQQIAESRIGSQNEGEADNDCGENKKTSSNDESEHGGDQDWRGVDPRLKRGTTGSPTGRGDATTGVKTPRGTYPT
jgi:hypothetical protein